MRENRNPTQSKNINVEIAELPRHLFNPSDAESLDIRRLLEFDNVQSDTRILTLKAGEGEIITINSYALYTDIEYAMDVEFFIRKNGGRQLKYHGVPDDPINPKSYRLSIGVSPDFSNNALIPCQIKLNPNDVLTIDAVSDVNANSNFKVPLGARISGYVQSSTNKSSARA